MKRFLVPVLLVVAASLVPAAPAPSAAKGGVITGAVLVAQDGKLVKTPDYVYVYLEEATPSRRPGEGMSARITQSGQEFDPHVVVVPSYANVFFPNRDNQPHSVFSPPDPPEDNSFYLKPYGKSDPGKSHRFIEPHEYKIYCDIHMQMWAYVKVVPSRYIARVENGRFVVSGLPPGTYKAVAWAPQALDVKSEWITLTGDETQTAAELHLQTRPRPVTHLRLDGSEYAPDKRGKIYK